MNLMKLSETRFADFDSRTFFFVTPDGKVNLSCNTPMMWEFADQDAAQLKAWLEANATTPDAPKRISPDYKS